MTSQDEPMTGWDNPEDFDNALDNTPPTAGRTFLLALAAYMEDPNTSNGIDLRNAMRSVDWNAVDFTLDALARGEQIFSAHETNDVLIRYNAG